MRLMSLGKCPKSKDGPKRIIQNFTSMEIYVAYKDYIWLMEMVRKLIEQVTEKIHARQKFLYGGIIGSILRVLNRKM